MTISIPNDNVFEDQEGFSVVLTSQQPWYIGLRIDVCIDDNEDGMFSNKDFLLLLAMSACTTVSAVFTMLLFYLAIMVKFEEVKYSVSEDAGNVEVSICYAFMLNDSKELCFKHHFCEVLKIEPASEVIANVTLSTAGGTAIREGRVSVCHA